MPQAPELLIMPAPPRLLRTAMLRNQEGFVTLFVGVDNDPFFRTQANAKYNAF